MIEAQLALELLVAPFDLPPLLPEADSLLDRGVRWQIRERVLDGVVLAPLDQQPACNLRRIGDGSRRDPTPPALGRPDPDPGEIGPSFPFVPSRQQIVVRSNHVASVRIATGRGPASVRRRSSRPGA